MTAEPPTLRLRDRNGTMHRFVLRYEPAQNGCRRWSTHGIVLWGPSVEFPKGGAVATLANGMKFMCRATDETSPLVGLQRVLEVFHVTAEQFTGEA